MDGRVYLPNHPAILSNEVKINVDESEKNESILLKRHSKNILELEYIPSLHFKDMVKDEILDQITQVTESKLSGWTHESQKSILDQAIASAQIDNEVVKKSLQDKIIKSTLLDLMLYGKYILQYRKSGNHHDKELFYINQFKTRLAVLVEKFPDIKQLIHEFSEMKGFFRILPLAYSEIIKHDELIVEFREAEIVGHNVSYAVAKNNGRFKKVLVDKNSNASVERYLLQEIIVLKDNARDLALKGTIVIPADYSQDEVVTVYIAWAGTHNKETFEADQQIAPGEESYRCGEDQILKQIIESLQAIGKPIKLVISGHSLGAALAQLCFHSIQRVIAKNIKDELIHEKVAWYEDEFIKQLDKLSPHQKDLDSFVIDPTMIREMTIAAWNPTGVLAPVIKNTNQLCPILLKAKISQNAHWGLVGDDLLQWFGQGYILNNVLENGAHVKILKIESKKWSQWLSKIGIPAAIPAGLLTFGTTIGGWAASLACFGLVVGKVINDKSAAHRKHHFVNGTRPEDAYIIIDNFNPDGSINVENCKLIQEELTYKPPSIVEGGIQYLSETMMQDERFRSSFQKAINASRKSLSEPEKKLNELPVFHFLMAKMKSGYDNARIIKLINTGQLRDVVHLQDGFGKTFLHHALEMGNLPVAQALLSLPDVNVNLLDQQNNFPLLLFFKYVDTFYLPLSESISQFGIQLLNKTTLDLNVVNAQGESVNKFYKKWYWTGSSAKQLMQELSKRLVVPKRDELTSEVAQVKCL